VELFKKNKIVVEPVVEPVPEPPGVDDGTRPEPPSEPLPPSRAACYVLASGLNVGAMVPVTPVGETISNTDTGEDFVDLALVAEPQTAKIYRTKARYSDGKEPGTWHYV